MQSGEDGCNRVMRGLGLGNEMKLTEERKEVDDPQERIEIIRLNADVLMEQRWPSAEPLVRSVYSLSFRFKVSSVLINSPKPSESYCTCTKRISSRRLLANLKYY